MARPLWKPTSEQRLTVSIMAACGMPHPEICKQIINMDTGKPVSAPTFYKVFRAELDSAKEKANAMVAQRLFAKATGNGAQSVTAAIFWLKTQARWRETERLEVVGKDGGPIAIYSPKEIESLSLEELAVLEKVAERKAAEAIDKAKALPETL